ncbi:MAG: NYN domain-containing protein [Acholeplasmataceae bacterium]|nr:NYN domain-containing protein [Acholeplasmataceae bacterium]
METKDYRIALLIDSENISAKYIKPMMNEIAKYGRIIISRFYGDLYKLSKEWNETALNYAIKPVHQYNVASGKNAADMAMAIDALEMMYQQKVNTFFLVTSDSDFTPLAMKLREGGMTVIGMGEENKVSQAFKSACSEFKYFAYLEDDEDHDDNDDYEDIEKIIKDMIIERGNKMPLSDLGNMLRNRSSDFDVRKYGVKNLSSLVNTFSGMMTTHNDMIVEFHSGIQMETIVEETLKILTKQKEKKMLLTKLKKQLEATFSGFNYKEYGYSQFGKFIGSIKQVTVNSQWVHLNEK